MPLEFSIEVFESLPSTQDLARSRVEKGAAEGLVIQALEQSDGRGRQGRAWVSGQGNLTLSFILRPACSAQKIGQISLMIGVALARAIGETAVLKWPNDVMVGGKKCAGVLIESDLQGGDVNWLVVGVGVNTASAPEMGCAIDVDRDAFRDVFLNEVGALYAHWQEHGFEDIRRQWLARSHPKGAALNIGAFEDLDAEGNLVVRDAQNALQTYSSGDVYLAQG